MFLSAAPSGSKNGINCVIREGIGKKKGELRRDYLEKHENMQKRLRFDEGAVNAGINAGLMGPDKTINDGEWGYHSRVH